MLNLFKTLFSHERDNVCFPESFVRDSIERVVDGTDTWLRGLSGYRRELRPAVLRSLEHVTEMCGSLDSPLPLIPKNWEDDPHLRNYFVSEERLQTVVQTNPALKEYRRLHPERDNQPVYGFMRMNLSRKPFMGVDKINGVITRGVSQTLVSFKGHQFLDLCSDSGEVRRLLKQRAFDHLIRLALDRLAMASGLRKELQTRSELLQAKLRLLKDGQWGLDLDGKESAPPKSETLSEQLEEIETLMEGVGNQNDYLEHNLKIVVDLMSTPEKHLWFEREVLHIDRDGILRRKGREDAMPVNVVTAHNIEGWSMAVSFFEIPPETFN